MSRTEHSENSIRLLCMSDIHCRFAEFLPERLPPANLCLVAGDLTNWGMKRPDEVAAARRWLVAMGKHCDTLWIPGNHDIGIGVETLAGIEGVSCILGQRVTYGRLTLYGVSCSVCYDKPHLATQWDYSTAERAEEVRAYDFPPVDIVVSHCPPLHACDETDEGKGRHIGSEYLRRYIEANVSRLVVCGHVHEAAGETTVGRTRVLNVAQRWELIDLPTPPKLRDPHETKEE